MSSWLCLRVFVSSWLSLRGFEVRDRRIELLDFLRAQPERRGADQLINLLRVARAHDRGGDAGWRSVHAMATLPALRPCLARRSRADARRETRLREHRLLIEAVVAAPVSFGQRRNTARASSCRSAGPTASASTGSRRCCARGRTAGSPARSPGAASNMAVEGSSASRCVRCASAASTSKFDTPMNATLPSSLSFVSVVQASSIDTGIVPLQGSPATRASESDRDRCVRSAGAAGSARLLCESIAREAVRRVPLVVPHEAAFREHVRPLALRDVLQRLADDFLRVAEPVDGRGVDPVQPVLDRAANRRDGIGIVLRSPPESPFAADRPRAKADGGEVREWNYREGVLGTLPCLGSLSQTHQKREQKIRSSEVISKQNLLIF